MFETRVHLELWVKVKLGWANDELILRNLGSVDELQEAPMDGQQRAFVLHAGPYSEPACFWTFSPSIKDRCAFASLCA